jgi:hypothetical protein
LDRERLTDAGHRNLAERCGEIAEDSGGSTRKVGEAFMWAAASDYPAILNGVVRLGGDPPAGELLDAAETFFSAQDRGFTVLTRDLDGIDADLDSVLDDRGARLVMERFPVMVCADPLGPGSLAPGAELRPVRDVAGVDDYITVTNGAYLSLDFPADFGGEAITREWMLRPNVAAAVAYLDGEPVCAASVSVSHGVGGLMWVGTLDAARGKGLAGACTRWATDAAFELGAEVAWLEASRLGESLYRRLGYEELFTYRFWILDRS